MPTIKKKDYSARDLREVSDNPEWTKEDFAKPSLLQRLCLISPRRFAGDGGRIRRRQKSWCRYG